MTDEWNEEEEYLENDELSITDDPFDSLNDILCETCGKPCEHLSLLEDADFSTVLRVCGDCVWELPQDNPDRFRPISG